MILPAVMWLWVSRGVGAGGLAVLRAWFPFVSDDVWVRWGSGFHYDVPNDVMPTWTFFVLFFIMFCLYGLAIRCRPQQPGVRDLFHVLAVAIVLRAILFFSVPVHENDFYRYLWDGRVFSAGINPYRYAPLEVTGFSNPYDNPSQERLVRLMQDDQVSFDRIGYPWVVTIYPPVAQVLFALAVRLFGASLEGWRLMVLLCEAGLIIALIFLLRASGRPATDVLIYAWSPLALKEFVNSAHLDVAALLLMMVACVALWRNHRTAAAVAAACGASVKYFPALILPCGRELWRRRDWVLFASVMIAWFVPFVVWQKAGGRVFEGLQAYHEHWVYHPFLFGFIQRITAFVLQQPPQAVLAAAKVVSGVLYGVVLAVILSAPMGEKDARERLLKRLCLAVAWLFLFSPAAYPWYLCWVLPLLCFFPYQEWILLSGLIGLTYASFRSQAPWLSESFLGLTRLAWIIYGPFCAVGLWRFKNRIKVFFCKRDGVCRF